MDTAQNTQDESKVRYVEELESENDYWLSITDAARICRVQDVSIRRAIAAGRLPVRQQGAGDNKRTRFVRASDLPRANFTILDASAAITSDIRKVDILSIPLLQQKLGEQQEAQGVAFTQLEARLTEQLAAMAEAQRAQAERYEQDQRAIQERMSQIEATFTTTLLQQQEEFSQYRLATDQQLAALALAQATLQTSLQEGLEALERKTDQVTQRLASQIKSITSQQEADLDKIKRLREQIDTHESAQVEALSQLGVSITGMKSLHDGLQLQISELEKEQARDVADLNSQIEKDSRNIWQRITILASADESQKQAHTGVQQQVSTHELRLTELFRLLQEEIATRQALSEELAAQKKTPTPRAKKA